MLFTQLTGASVQPLNIENKKVSLRLNMYCEQTAAALKMSPCSTESSQVTSRWVEMVVQLWKLWNTKSRFSSIRRNDPDRLVIDKSPDGERALKLLRDWAKLADFMTQNETHRIQKLTRDTGKALRWTCLCLADLSEYLLNTDTNVKHDYVCLGFFQQDDLEAHFGHFRMASGWNYHITVNDVMTTHSQDKARQMLKLCGQDEEIPRSYVAHSCELCVKDLVEEEVLLLDEMPQYLAEVSADDKLNVFYIAGYVASKNKQLAGSHSDENYEDGFPSDFLETLDRGKLTYPSRPLYDLSLLAFVFFVNTPEKLCRSRFISIITGFPALFHIDLFPGKDSLSRLANIFMKRFAQARSALAVKKGMKSNQKIIKLSSL